MMIYIPGIIAALKFNADEADFNIKERDKHRNANAYFLLTIFITDSVRGIARPESGEVHIMNKNIESNRKHIANAFVDYCKRRNCGHSVCVVTVGRKQIILGDLTADGVHRCLKDCFEVECIKNTEGQVARVYWSRPIREC